jgi:hypothetical protein
MHGEIKKKNWNQNKYSLLRKVPFTFSDGDVLKYSYLPLEQKLRIFNKNKDVYLHFEAEEIVGMKE